MNNILLLDIDGTLFDPDKFGKLIRSHFVEILGIDEEELVRANADYYAELEESLDFNPRDIAVFLAKRFGKSSDELDKVFWENEEIYKESLYPEVLDALVKLSKDRNLGIFSQGNIELQNRKLEASKIRHYFNDELVFINRRKLSDDSLALLPREATVVDDNHEVVVKIANLSEAIWLNRRTDDIDPNVRTVHALSEL